LLPGIVVFFPEFDQAFPMLSMLLMIGWVKALEGQYRHALLLAFALIVSSFFAYNLLLTGLPLALYGAYYVAIRRGEAAAWLRPCAIAGAVFALVLVAYAAFWLAAGYNPVSSLQHAIANQAIISSHFDRPRWARMLFDPYDFFLGSGMLAVPLMCIYWTANKFDWKREDVVLSLIGLGSIAILAASALLFGEAARVWLFLQPFVVVPAGLAVARFRAMECVAVFALQWAIVVILTCKMAFIIP
jgi:hypothetical protein